MNDFAGALAAFDAAQLADPQCIDAAIESGHIHLHLKNGEESERHFRKALDRDPDNVPALTGLSYALRQLGALDQAETVLKHALTLRPNDNGAMTGLTSLFETQHRIDEAIDLLESAIALDAGSPARIAALAQLYRRRGDHETALRYFTAAADAEPDNSGRARDVAVGLRELGRMDEATRIIDAVLAKCPADESALAERGIQLRWQSRHEEAHEVFSQIQRINPRNAQNLVELATEKRALGQLQPAERSLKDALQLEPNQLGALLQLGELAALKGDVERAQSFFQAAREAHPENIWPWLKAAWTAFDAGDSDEAFSLIWQARERFRSCPEIDAVEVDLLRKQRDLRGARAVLQRADTAGLSSFWLSTHRIQIETSTAHYDNAEALLSKMNATSASELARVALLRGQIAEAQYDYPGAISHYEAATRLTPADGWAHMDLARASLMELDTGTARAELATFAKSSKSYLVPKGQSINLSQSHVGQLLEDFELDQSALAKLREARAMPLADQLPILRSIVQVHPDCTSAAIATTIALRRNGRFSGFALPVESSFISPIPQQIVQFWDADPPPDVVDLMTSWQQMNPQYGWTCFNDRGSPSLSRASVPAFRSTSV